MVTQVAFHFNATDKLRYACRFSRKALRRGASVVITVPPQALDALDALLWSFSPTDFVAHCRADSDADTLAVTPVILCAGALPLQLPHHDILLNLTDASPGGYERFGSVVEVVRADDVDRAAARTRWRAYAAQGLQVKGHDLVLKES